MDNNINPTSGISQTFTFPVKPLQAPFPLSPDTAAGTASSPAGVDFSGDSAKEEVVRQAALSFKNFYAISDKEFSLFKDADGNYITRYVSLRDGTVTYVPEPELLRHALASNSQAIAVVKVDA